MDRGAPTVECEVREWARQDALRTFDDRRKAYLDLLGMLRALEEVVVEAARSNKPLDGDWFVVLFEAPNRIRVFASDVGQHAVSNAFTALLKYGRSINDQENHTAAGSAFGAAVAILVEVVRQDLESQTFSRTFPWVRPSRTATCHDVKNLEREIGVPENLARRENA